MPNTQATRVVCPARMAIVACVLALSACPDAASSKLTQLCGKAYDKCLLPSGVLGICDSVECVDGKSPPCLICRSQH